MPGSKRCVGRDDCHEMKVTCPLLTLGKLISVVVSKSVPGNRNGEDDFSVEWKPIQVARRIWGQLRLGVGRLVVGDTTPPQWNEFNDEIIRRGS